MTGTVWHVAAAALVLLATHFGPTTPGVRGAIVARIGEGPFRGLYSLVSAAAIWWLAAAWAAAPTAMPVPPLPGAAWIALPATALAALLLVGSLTQPNPTAVPDQSKPLPPGPVGVQRITRHPLMWAVGIWAAAHLVANPDLASVFLFGGIGTLALAGTLRLDAKAARRRGAAWDAYAAATSNVPFAAVLAGRQRLDASEIGWRRAALAALLWGVLVLAHPPLFGVAALPG